MRMQRVIVVVLGAFLVSCGAIWASSHRSEKALWIEVKQNGECSSMIAMTENIARQLLESDETNVNFSDKRKRDLVTKDMLRSVLDGRQESADAVDEENGSAVRIYLADLKVPGNQDGGTRLVLETYKAGSKTFRIALPEIELEDAEEGTGNMIQTSIGWRGLLPFLSHGGGAVYVKDENHDTEVWIYVE